MNLRFWTRTFWSDIGYGLGSGPILVRHIISLADISSAQTIVELGAGYGQVTRQLIAHKSPTARLIVIENDPERVIELRNKYGQYCDIHAISAAHIGEFISPGSADLIISTLPLGSISPEGVDHILRAAELALSLTGRFLQYQYALQNLGDVRRYFDISHISFELFNFWPAFIYQARKK